MKQTIVSTATSEWRTVEWDEESETWKTVASGDIVFETTGDAPQIPCAFMRGGKVLAMSSRDDR